MREGPTIDNDGYVCVCVVVGVSAVSAESAL